MHAIDQLFGGNEQYIKPFTIDRAGRIAAGGINDFTNEEYTLVADALHPLHLSDDSTHTWDFQNPEEKQHNARLRKGGIPQPDSSRPETVGSLRSPTSAGEESLGTGGVVKVPDIEPERITLFRSPTSQKSGTLSSGSNWFDDADIADYQHGLCDTYALALIEMYPHLRLGITGPMADNPDDGWIPSHYFAHDDEYAYDSLGRHPLPYRGLERDWGEGQLDTNPADYFTSQTFQGENASPGDYERAKTLIPKQHPWLKSSNNSGKTARESSEVMYHVAPSDARESIEQYGLDSTRSMYDRWNDDPGFYAFTDLDEARWYKTQMTNYARQEGEDISFDIWEVTPTTETETDWSLYPDQDEPTSAVWHSETIGPKTLKRIGTPGNPSTEEWSFNSSSDEYYPDEFMTGQCAAWAIAHHQLHPDLRFGMHYEELSSEEQDKREIEDGYRPTYEIQHVFTHDDNFAYDAEGAHPMPYNGWDRSEFDLTSEDVEMSGMLEPGYMPEPDALRQHDPRTSGSAHGADSRRVYHIAPTTERDRIQAHGLQPSRPSSHWGPIVENQPEGVYVVKEDDRGMNIDFTADMVGKEPYDVWEIPADQTEGMVEDELFTSPGAYIIPHQVFPELHRRWEDMDQWGVLRDWGKTAEDGSDLWHSMSVGYHVAPTQVRDKIQQEGLKKAEPYVPGAARGIYLHKTEEEARQWADPYEDYEDYDIWKVTLPISTVGIEQGGEGHYFYPGDIPPENTELVRSPTSVGKESLDTGEGEYYRVQSVLHDEISGEVECWHDYEQAKEWATNRTAITGVAHDIYRVRGEARQTDDLRGTSFVEPTEVSLAWDGVNQKEASAGSDITILRDWGKTAHEDYWEPGQQGRGLVYPSGQVDTWSAPEDEQERYHVDYYPIMTREDDPRHRTPKHIWIEPDGYVNDQRAFGGEVTLTDEEKEAVRKHNPDLQFPEDQDSKWVLPKSGKIASENVYHIAPAWDKEDKGKIAAGRWDNFPHQLLENAPNPTWIDVESSGHPSYLSDISWPIFAGPDQTFIGSMNGYHDDMQAAIIEQQSGPGIAHVPPKMGRVRANEDGTAWIKWFTSPPDWYQSPLESEPDPKWTFETSWRDATEPPQVVEVGGSNYDQITSPMIYVPDNDTIYIGQPGESHSQLAGDQGLSDMDRYQYGYVYRSDAGEHVYFGWYSPPPRQERVEKALYEGGLEKEVGTTEGDDGWTFETATNIKVHQTPYEPDEGIERAKPVIVIGNDVYVGAPGQYHAQTATSHGVDWDEVIRLSSYFGSIERDEIGWYNPPPKAMKKEIESQLGVTPYAASDSEIWGFEAAEGEKPWNQRWDEYYGKNWKGFSTFPEYIEYVPTEALIPYQEYDRDLSSEYSTDLATHIENYGVHSPIILEYNVDNGQVHIGEGNHRLKIALQQGIEAVPVRVYTSMRQGQNYGMVPEPYPPDEFNYVPQHLKPSDIGLPTVDPPKQSRTSSNVKVHWMEDDPQPGYLSIWFDPITKQIYTGPQLYHHRDIVAHFHLGLEPGDQDYYYRVPGYIPGTYHTSSDKFQWYNVTPNEVDEQSIKHAILADLDMEPAEEETWDFQTKTAKPEVKVPLSDEWGREAHPYIPGESRFLKGFIGPDGNIYAWEPRSLYDGVPEEDGHPFHGEAIRYTFGEEMDIRYASDYKGFHSNDYGDYFYSMTPEEEQMVRDALHMDMEQEEWEKWSRQSSTYNLVVSTDSHGRQPHRFIYVPDQNTVYAGWNWHSDLIVEFFGSIFNLPHDSYQGELRVDRDEKIHGPFRWHPAPPPDYQQLNKFLTDQFDYDLNEDEWAFEGANASKESIADQNAADPEQLPLFEKAPPRPKAPEPEEDIKTPARPEDIKVEYPSPDFQMDPDAADWVGARKVFIYDPDTRTLHMGNWGEHHFNIAAATEEGNIHGWLYDPNRQVVPVNEQNNWGVQENFGGENGGFGAGDDRIRWWDGRGTGGNWMEHPDRPAVEEVIWQLNPGVEQLDDSEWDMTSKTAAQLVEIDADRHGDAFVYDRTRDLLFVGPMYHDEIMAEDPSLRFMNATDVLFGRWERDNGPVFFSPNVDPEIQTYIANELKKNGYEKTDKVLPWSFDARINPDDPPPVDKTPRIELYLEGSDLQDAAQFYEWMPGHFVKGIITDGGSTSGQPFIWLWSGEGMAGNPHHFDMLGILGIEPEEDIWAFGITEEGNVIGDEGVSEYLTKSGLFNLVDYGSSWGFATKVAGHILRYDQDDQGAAGAFLDWQNGRRPVVYFPESGDIAIGPPGRHHSELLELYGDDPNRSMPRARHDEDAESIGEYENAVEGYVVPDYGEGAIADQSPGLHWFFDHQVPDEINEKIEQALNIGANDEDQWRFGSALPKIEVIDRYDEPDQIDPYSVENWADQRIPVIYSPERETIFIGEPGTHHLDLDRFIFRQGPNDYEEGMRWDQNAYFGNYYPDEPDFAWSSAGGWGADNKEPEPEITEIIRNYFGLGEQVVDPEWTWDKTENDKKRPENQIVEVVNRVFGGTGEETTFPVNKRLSLFGITVIMVQTAEREHGEGHPFIYKADQNTLYVGGRGGFHMDIARSEPTVEYTVGDRTLMAGRVDPDRIIFFPSPNWTEAIKDAITNALASENLGYDTENDEWDIYVNGYSGDYDLREDWKMGATEFREETLPGAEPRTDSSAWKGILTPSGVFYTWNCGENQDDGPHHLAAILELTEAGLMDPATCDAATRSYWGGFEGLPDKLPPQMKPEEEEWRFSPAERPSNGNSPTPDVTSHEGAKRAVNGLIHKAHRNPNTGKICHCPWCSPKMKRIASVKEAGEYLNRVFNQAKRGDKRLKSDEGQDLLKALSTMINMHEEWDELAPYIANRWKQGEIQVMPPINKAPAEDLAPGDRVFFDNRWYEVYPRGRGEALPGWHPADHPEAYAVPPRGLPVPLGPLQAQHDPDTSTPREDWTFGEATSTVRGDTLLWTTNLEVGEPVPDAERFGALWVEGGGGRVDYGNRLISLEQILPEWMEWYSARNDPLRQGVNIMDKNWSVDNMRDQVIQFQQKQEKKRERERLIPELRETAQVDYQFDNGWQVVELSQMALGPEGEAMNHCIGNDPQYADCLDAETIRVFSLRDEDGWPHATWHTNEDAYGNRTVAEKFGRGDRPLKPEYEAMYEKWCEANDLDPEPVGHEGGEQFDLDIELAPITTWDELMQYRENPWDMAMEQDFNPGEDSDIYADIQYIDVFDDAINSGRMDELIDFLKDDTYGGASYEIQEFVKARNEWAQQDGYGLGVEQNDPDLVAFDNFVQPYYDPYTGQLDTNMYPFRHPQWEGQESVPEGVWPGVAGPDPGFGNYKQPVLYNYQDPLFQWQWAEQPYFRNQELELQGLSPEEIANQWRDHPILNYTNPSPPPPGQWTYNARKAHEERLRAWTF
jgi:hypothetical protein